MCAAAVATGEIDVTGETGETDEIDVVDEIAVAMAVVGS